jgi:hypothetical protein
MQTATTTTHKSSGIEVDAGGAVTTEHTVAEAGEELQAKPPASLLQKDAVAAVDVLATAAHFGHSKY